MTERQVTRVFRWSGWVALGGATLVVAFWALYLSGGIAPAGDPLLDGYEAAFPVADALLAVLLTAAGASLLRRRASGPFLLVAAAAMTLYLGLLDLTFYGRQSLATGAAWAPMQLAIIFLCVAGGTVGLRLGWVLWRRR